MDERHGFHVWETIRRSYDPIVVAMSFWAQNFSGISSLYHVRPVAVNWRSVWRLATHIMGCFDCHLTSHIFQSLLRRSFLFRPKREQYWWRNQGLSRWLRGIFLQRIGSKTRMDSGWWENRKYTLITIKWSMLSHLRITIQRVLWQRPGRRSMALTGSVQQHEMNPPLCRYLNGLARCSME